MTATAQETDGPRPDAAEVGSGALEVAARLGLTARAFTYLVIALLAFGAALGHSDHETDQGGAFEQVNRFPLGHLGIWVVTAGLAGYSLWRLSEVVVGPVGEGGGAGGRLKSLFRCAVYAFFAVNAAEVARGGRVASQAGRQETITAELLGHPGGRWAVGVAGVIVAVVGLSLVVEGIGRRFERFLRLGGEAEAVRRAVRVLGVVGTTARGAVFTLAGALVVDAALRHDPTKAAGVDGALRSLRDEPAGPWLLGAAAAGLLAFALYGFAEARWRRT